MSNNSPPWPIPAWGKLTIERATRLIPLGTEEPFSRFLGASLLSATGSLPQHIAPLLIIVIVADGRMSASEAGWILSVRTIGELLASIALPMIGLIELSRITAIAASALFVSALFVAEPSNLICILFGFFVLGASSGVLKFLGTVAASNYRHRTFAFLFRLASVLGIAGASICLLFATRALTSYVALLHGLIFISIPILTIGGLLYRPLHQPPIRSNHLEQAKSVPERSSVPVAGISGLLLLYLFFVTISGFMAYVGQQASMKGLSIEDTVLSIGTIKIVSAIALLAAAFLLAQRGKEIVALEIVLLIAAMWIVYLSSNIPLFFAGFLLLEVTLNGCSGRLQSSIVGAAPQFTGRWLNGVVLMGTATGPPLYGLAIGAEVQNAFMIFASVVIGLPIAWQATRGSGKEKRR